MAKTKSAYVCNDCGADFVRWQGQCTECGAWNSISEVRLPSLTKQQRFDGYAGATAAKVIRWIRSTCRMYRDLALVLPNLTGFWEVVLCQVLPS